LAIALQDVVFAYTPPVEVLHIAALDIERGVKVFLYGPSGSGKTTLLGLLAGVLQANAGRVHVCGRDLTHMTSAARDDFRGEYIGYIFQMFNLIPYLNVLENVMLPCQLNPRRRRRLGQSSLEKMAREMVQRLGMGDCMTTDVTALSVGQQQRVAVARALLGTPELIIADEPTSALDIEHRDMFLQLLFENCQATGATLLFVSHDQTLIPRFDRSISLSSINHTMPGTRNAYDAAKTGL
jgi:putative ABC transport system ATP-binding protein